MIYPYIYTLSLHDALPILLAAVFYVEVVIAPFFEKRVNVLIKRAASVFGGAVPVPAILFVTVIRREVIATTEPPHGVGAGLLGDKKSYVGMAGGQIRGMRVD